MTAPTSKYSNDGDDAVEPIAIIGSACRFSGIASTEAKLWQMLCQGMTSWEPNARRRFQLDAFWHPQAQLSGSFNCRGLHLLQQDPAVFDNDFFGISGVEAKAIDPQQRMMLEVAYEAFENAGITMEQLQGTNTGVYCAVSYHDYDQIQGRDPEVSPLYRFTGTGPSLIANRVSYIFDLKGPSMSIDTACSSTLVAVHEACRALRAGDAKQMLVGGTNLILDPDKVTVISSMQFLSDHGRCYSFDSRGSGYGRGEGVAAVLLKPLPAAIRDGDAIRGVIRGSAVGSDGKTPGITMPSSAAQLDTIRRAYQQAGLDPRQTVYVEAHGTGTTVGDGCEVETFRRAFCAQRDDKLLVSSVKANLGHTECVSGLAGLIKALLMLENATIPPHPTLESVTLSLQQDDVKGIEIPSKLMEWPVNTTRRASVNSSGYGGMNAHVILEAWSNQDRSSIIESPDATKMDENGTSNIMSHGQGQRLILTWSHQREDGLTTLIAIWKRFIMATLANSERLSIYDLALTLNDRRSRFPYRAAVAVSDLNQLLAELTQLATGSPRPTRTLTRPATYFMFTGQGAQWATMGVALLHTYPVFAKSLRLMEQHIRSFGADWYLISELEKPDEISRLNEAELGQPCCTALQIALVDLLESWNVLPAAVCGHSSGEIAAAYAARAVVARDAIKIAYFRGQAVRHLGGLGCRDGAMLAVGLSETDVARYLTSGYEKRVSVACINSPSTVTLSGDADAVGEVANSLKLDNVFCRELAVGVAYHSHHMKHVEEYYRSSIADITPKAGKSGVVFVSSVTGSIMSGSDLGPAYWTKNLVSPVKFSDALAQMVCPGSKTQGTATVPAAALVEIGPHSTLQGPATQTLRAFSALHSVQYWSCLVRNQDASASTSALACQLFKLGSPIHLNAVNQVEVDHGRPLSNLPSYNWHHGSSHWNESRRSAAHRLRKNPRHDLLGNLAFDSISAEPCWHHYIRASEMPWIQGHCIDGQVVFPAAGYISMIVEAKRMILHDQPWKNKVVEFKDITIKRPMLIKGDDPVGVEVFTSLRPAASSPSTYSSTWWDFRIFSVSPSHEATEHCRGSVAVVPSGKSGWISQITSGERQRGEADDGASIESAKNFIDLEPKMLYRELKHKGMDYSGTFACLESIAAQPWRCRATLCVPDVASSMPARRQSPHLIHPVILEGCLHATHAGLKVAKQLKSAAVITKIEAISISTNAAWTTGTRLSITAESRPFGLDKYISNVSVTNNEGKSDRLIQIRGVEFSPSLRSFGLDGNGQEDEALCHCIDWKMDPTASPAEKVQFYCKGGMPEQSMHLRRYGDMFCHGAFAKILSELTPDQECAVAGHLLHYLQWIRSHHDPQIPASMLEMEEAVAALGAVGETLQHIIRNFSDLLLAKSDGLSILLEDNLLYRAWFEDECLNRCHYQLASYLSLLKFKQPNLRILEIGGGTGSLALPAVQALAMTGQDGSLGHCRYVFSDISTCFFSNLQKKLNKFESSIEYKTLDLEQPPEEQGFELQSFDVIVASNAIHVVPNLDKALTYIRNLLKPGGQLAFVETTAPSLRWTMAFGSIPGWWVGAESGRIASPFLPADKWNSLLLANGFSGISLEMKDYDDDKDHECSVLVCHRDDVIDESLGPDTLVIVTPDGQAPEKMALEVCNQITTRNASVMAQVIPVSQVSELPGANFIFLLELDREFLIDPTEAHWCRVRDAICTAKEVWWVTKGATMDCPQPQRGLVSGMGRALRAENPELKFRTLDLEAGVTDDQVALHVSQLYERFTGPKASPHYTWEWEIAVRDGCVMLPRVIIDAHASAWAESSLAGCRPRETGNYEPNRGLCLRVRSPGMLDSLFWADDDDDDTDNAKDAGHGTLPMPSQVRIEVSTASLNFKDLMVALGQLNGHRALLIEGSGTVSAVGQSVNDFQVGDNVCFFAPTGLATNFNIDRNLVCAIPNGMQKEVAAAIPVAYSTALYSLRDVARLSRGESILIHSGAGAVGQAAIAVARYLGAGAIFVTAGSPERRDFIATNLHISASHILSSRDSSFVEGIMARTGGRGVDIVLNSLGGELLAAGFRSMAPFGRFVEIGKMDILRNGVLGMRCLERNVTLSVVDMDLVATNKVPMFKSLLETAVALVHKGALKMLAPVMSKHAADIELQLRQMQAGQHFGKLTLQFAHMTPLKIRPQRPKLAHLRSNCSYLVIGGTGSLGKVIVRYLASLGAKRILTLSRSGSDAPGMATLIQEMSKSGVEVIAVRGSILESNAAQVAMAAAAEMPIKGVIQAVMALQDTSFQSMSRHQWCQGVQPKALGALHLQRKFKTVDFCILISSASAITGTISQSNYCAGNTVQDATARNQASLGLPMISIDLGVVQEDGALVDHDEIVKVQTLQGLRAQSVDGLLALINYAIQNPVAATPTTSQITYGVRRADPKSGSDEAARQRPDMRFSHIWSAPQQVGDVSESGDMDVRAALEAVSTPVAAIEVTYIGLKQKLAKLLAISVDDMAADRSVASYGIDSLISVELRNWITVALRAQVQMLELMSSLSILQLAEAIAQRSRLVPIAVFQKESHLGETREI
ncbi:hypothetical protein NHJ13051_009322 [Beauveria bassiana]